MRLLVTANTDAIEQLLALIELAPDNVYQNIPTGMTSTMGRHVRHVLDHYSALQVGVVNNMIDYDRRSRDSVIETDPMIATKQLNDLVVWMEDSISLDAPLKMKTEISMNNQESCQESCVVNSTLQRELIYLLNHTIHHVAYITLVLRTFGIKIDQYIGVAPATQSYLKSNTINQVG
ncbi:hypothetical protein JYT12_00295 [Beggiatoa alba]|nr:hypothetical protein [Beggiatoa alba]